MRILVGSENPIKHEAVHEAFSHYYEDIEIVGLKVPSGVPDQPINEETLRGAENRAEILKELNESENYEAEFFVGVEGGIIKKYGKWFAFGGMCIMHKSGKRSFGTSAHFELPQMVSKRLIEREELGDVMDEIIKMKNTKQNMGAIGFFTNGVMNRKELYVPGIIAALVPFNHEDMYFNEI
jgi:inosine/xanthosine triphosphatase